MTIQISRLTEADIPGAVTAIQQAFADDPYNLVRNSILMYLNALGTVVFKTPIYDPQRRRIWASEIGYTRVKASHIIISSSSAY